MKIMLIIFAILLLVLLILLLIPIRLELDYKKDAVTNKVTLYLKYMFFKFRLFKDKDKNKTTKKEKPPKEPFSFEREKAKIDGYIKTFESIKDDAETILDYVASRAAVFENVEFECEFGFEDAMHTGIFTGILNGFVYSVLGIIHHKSNLKRMNVNIQPVFGNVCFNLHSRCILHLKNVHIIVVAVNVLRLLRKIKKEEGRK